jgi:ribosomal protein L7/L12
MTVNKGLLSLVENTPNFSNQALENAVDTLKVGWVIKSSSLDTNIQNNTVLTTSQKNDLKDDINNIAHLNMGRVLGDLVRHSASIIDATIVPVPADETQTETFLGILQNVQTVQGLIPELHGVPASDKSRTVNNHLGTLNNIFVTTEDSTAPVFTSLLESINFVVTANLATETALETAYDNLSNFINGVVSDSTDFQQTLDTFATAVATAHTNFNNALAAEPYLTHRNNLTAMREKINVQVSLENSNLTTLSSYIETLSENVSYAALAEDATLRTLMSTVAQDTNWQTYFNNYESEQDNLNPIYTTDTDSDKSSVIDKVLADSGLPDVTDGTDLAAVADKAQRDTRIDTAGYNKFTVEQKITKSCEQLGITTADRTINSLSNTLLENMNQHDRDEIARQLDLNESANTLS